MAYFRLYIFRHKHISSFHDFEAASDASAIERSLELAEGEVAELWNEARHVHTFMPLRNATASGELAVGVESTLGEPSLMNPP
jgi:hypothetical protein